MAASILFLIPTLALATAPAHEHSMMCNGHQHVSAQAPAVLEFTAAVNRYLELHRLLDSPMSSITLGADPEQAARAREAHRDAIVEARITRPRGDVFTPTVAAYLRRQLKMVSRHAEAPDANVNEAAIQRLPPLPSELEYRFVDRDLVLLDMETDLVVDVLENALPPEPAMKASPCVAHPDLEMCWS